MNKKEEHKINYAIRDFNVRLVGDNVENGIIETKQAIYLAKSMGLDLVEISPAKNGNPPITKILDYKKFLYEQKKNYKDQKKKQKQNQTEIKEIRMTPNTDDHDFNFKLNHAIKFLKDNNKVLVTIFFKGREIIYKDKGQIILLRFADELKDCGIPENMPILQGKKMQMMIKPKK